MNDTIEAVLRDGPDSERSDAGELSDDAPAASKGKAVPSSARDVAEDSSAAVVKPSWKKGGSSASLTGTKPPRPSGGGWKKKGGADAGKAASGWVSTRLSCHHSQKRGLLAKAHAHQVMLPH